MAIRAVAFDIGGVLEITPGTGWSADWETRLGIASGEINVLLGDVWRDGSSGKIDEAEVERRVSSILKLSPSQLSAFMDDLWADYCGELNREMAEYFEGLRPRYTTAIISNSFAGARRKEQELYGFEDMCDLIVYSHEEGIAKPDRRIYELACGRLNVRPEEMVFLDDVEACVTAARDMGIRAVLFKNNSQAIADIEAYLSAQENR